MGSRVAANLRRTGFELTVWNRTAGRAREFAAAQGAEVAERPADVAAVADVVITMVVDAEQVAQVLLGDDGALMGARPGLLCVDMSTIGPAGAREIGAALAERQVHFVDAPVAGTSPRPEG